LTWSLYSSLSLLSNIISRKWRAIFAQLRTFSSQIDGAELGNNLGFVQKSSIPPRTVAFFLGRRCLTVQQVVGFGLANWYSPTKRIYKYLALDAYFDVDADVSIKKKI
jgi:hypothetical protein